MENEETKQQQQQYQPTSVPITESTGTCEDNGLGLVADTFLNSGLGHKKVSEVLSADMKSVVKLIQDLLVFGKSRVSNPSSGETESVHLAQVVGASSDLVSSFSDVVKFQSEAALECQKMAIAFMNVTVKLQEQLPGTPVDYAALGDTVVTNFEKDCNMIKTYNDLLSCAFDCIEMFEAAVNRLTDGTPDKVEATKLLVLYKEQVIAENGIIESMKSLIDIVKSAFIAIKDRVEIKVAEDKRTQTESAVGDEHCECASSSCHCRMEKEAATEKSDEEMKKKKKKKEEEPLSGNYDIIQRMIEYAKEMIMLSEVITGLSNDMYEMCSTVLGLSKILEADLKAAIDSSSSNSGGGESSGVNKNTIELFNCFADLAQLFAGGADLETDNGTLQAELASQYADLLKVVLANMYRGATADIVDIATHQSVLAEEQSGIAVKVTSWIRGRSELIAGLDKKEYVDQMALVLQSVKTLSSKIYDTALKQSNIAKGILALAKHLKESNLDSEAAASVGLTAAIAEDNDDDDDDDDDDDEVLDKMMMSSTNNNNGGNDSRRIVGEEEEEEEEEAAAMAEALMKKEVKEEEEDDDDDDDDESMTTETNKKDKDLNTVCVDQAKAAKVMAELGTKIVAAAKKMMGFGKTLMMDPETQEASGLMLEVAFTESALSSKQSTIAEKQSGLLGRQKVIIRLADDPAAAEEQLQVVRDQQALALEQMKVAQEQAAIAETIAQIADVVEKDEISAFSASLLGLAKEVVDIAKQLSIIY